MGEALGRRFQPKLTFQLENLRDFRYTTENDAIGGWIEVFRDEFCEKRREGGNHFRGLDNSGAASRNGTIERLERQDDGIVPGTA